MSRPPKETLAQWLAASGRAHRLGELAGKWTEWSVRSAVESGDAVRLLPGILAGAGHADQARVRAEALTLWHPSLHVSGGLALHLFNSALTPPTLADAVVPYGTRLATCEWARVSQRAEIRSSQRPQGIRCVVAERAVIDAWHWSGPDAGATVVYEALWVRVCTASAVLRELSRVPRVRNRRELVRLLERFRDGATSPLEVLAKEQVFVGTEWGDLEWQAKIATRTSHRRADILHRAARVIVELDGSRYHRSDAARERDRLRDIELAALGYLTVRLTFRDLKVRPQWCRDTVRDVIRQRLSVL